MYSDPIDSVIMYSDPIDYVIVPRRNERVRKVAGQLRNVEAAFRSDRAGGIAGERLDFAVAAGNE